jgi:hypothetical protein
MVSSEHSTTGRCDLNSRKLQIDTHGIRFGLLVSPTKMDGGEGRNRPDFPAVAPQICLISLGIQAKTVLSDPIVFNPFGVRFGVRLPISIL